MSGLTLGQLQAVNAQRARRWHHADTVPWTGADWSNALAGEVGEACNVVKKLRRHETGTATVLDAAPAELVADLGTELADVLCYAVLVASHYGIDLGRAVAQKFNHVSLTHGFPERLPVPPRG